VAVAQRQCERVSLLAGQRWRAGDHLVDIGIQIVITAIIGGAVLTAVTLA
jgi:hypothetical protein